MPVVRPSTIRRWKINAIITSGTVTILAGGRLLAERRLEFGGAGELGKRHSGRMDLGLIMDSTMLNSFQLWMRGQGRGGEHARRGER